jgi:tetratricopeptide (TPR) repeat protein
MATVSSNAPLTLAAVLLAQTLVCGCSSMTAASSGSTTSGPGDAAQKRTAHFAEAASAAPLPKQAYTSAGVKVPYERKPNPYLAHARSVPADAQSQFLEASSMLERGNVDGARAKFESLTERYPALSGPWVKLGDIAERADQHDKAIEMYWKAIGVNKKNVNAYIALGLAQRRQGLFSDARNTYVAALTLWKDFPEAHLNLAILYDLYLDMPEEAQKHFEAYQFLTGEKDEKVHKWLVEVRRRTGIERSFVDNPPTNVKEASAPKRSDPDTHPAVQNPG